MSTTNLEEIAKQHVVPITDEQEALVANLVNSGDIDFDALIEAGYPHMSRAYLSLWLNRHSEQLQRRREEVRATFKQRVDEALLARAAQMAEADQSQN